MNHAEFHRAVRAIARGRYFATDVKISEHTDYGVLEIEWRAYVDGHTWIIAKTAEECLDALRIAQPCCKCGNDSTSLCDYPLSAGRSGKTCDAQLCRRCARRLGTEELEKLRDAGIAITSTNNVDLCPAHARLVGLS